MKKIFKMKNLISVITVIIISSSFTFAQPQQGRPILPNDERINRMVDDMANQLSLTKSQKEEILTLHKEHFQKLKQMFKEEKTNRKKTKEEHEQLRMELEKDVESLLNDVQKTKYKEFVKKLEARRIGDGRPRDKKN